MHHQFNWFSLLSFFFRLSAPTFFFSCGRNWTIKINIHLLFCWKKKKKKKSIKSLSPGHYMFGLMVCERVKLSCCFRHFPFSTNNKSALICHSKRFICYLPLQFCIFFSLPFCYFFPIVSAHLSQLTIAQIARQPKWMKKGKTKIIVVIRILKLKQFHWFLFFFAFAYFIFHHSLSSLFEGSPGAPSFF